MTFWRTIALNRTTLVSVAGLAVLVLTTVWASQRTGGRIDQAVRQNFVAAGMLSQLQVEGERMRRYEKEMFIYVATPDKRAGYVKEFREAYDKALVLLDTMLAPSSRLFSELEQKEVAAWKAASAFYYGEFDRLARQADALNLASLGAEQRGGLTLQFNDGIKAGKDRFRELLNGTAKMRAQKQAQSAAIAGEIDTIVGQMVKLVAVVALALAIGIALTTAPARGAAGGLNGAAQSSRLPRGAGADGGSALGG